MAKKDIFLRQFPEEKIDGVILNIKIEKIKSNLNYAKLMLASVEDLFKKENYSLARARLNMIDQSMEEVQIDLKIPKIPKTLVKSYASLDKKIKAIKALLKN